MSSTKIKDIIEYWAYRESEAGLGVDWAEAHERCWRCGDSVPLEMCHIVPASLGGPEEPSNLILLCKWCHEEAPNIDDPKYMWIWLRATSSSFYDTHRMNRAFVEFEKIFGRRAFSDPRIQAEAEKRLQEVLSNPPARGIVHFGRGHMNAATLACLIHKIEEALLNDKSNDQ